MINFTFTGDFAPNASLLDAISQSNTRNYFEDLLPYLEKADLNVTNLESPIIEKASKAQKYGPILSTDHRAVDLLQQGDFKLVTLANNHLMDHGDSGLHSTINYLKSSNIAFVGGGVNLQEAAKPFIFTKDQKRIGILNVAENEFSNTTGDFPGAAPLDFADNALAIKALKQKVDFVIVIVHGGAELHHLPSPRFKKTLRFMADQGANLVLAHHTHCYNGYEIYNNTPIFYGLGNFVFPAKSKANEDWHLGVLLSLTINDDLSVDFKTIPFFQNLNQFGISLLEDQKLSDFRNNEAHKNSIVNDDIALEKNYHLFFKKVEKQYLHYLQPYTSKYLHKLYSLGILPSFLQNKTKKMLYLNLIRCEAHRDILLKILR
jgi:poly-gamma-glutamate synthesis protein (capsule biosynthesis protein)